MSAIKGQDVSMYGKDDNGNYQLFACATAMSFSYDTELIEKATVNMAGFRSYKSGFSDCSATLNSVTNISYGSELTVFYTLLQTIRKQGLDIQMVWQDDVGNLKVISGHAFIPHTGITVDIAGFSEDDIQFKFSGGVQMTTTLISNTTTNGTMQTPIYYTFPSNGATSYQNNLLINVHVVHVERNGIGQKEIAAGTPSANEFKYIAGTGTIQLDSNNPSSAGETLFIAYYI